MVGVRLHRLDDEIPPDAVEELLDVQIDHPVVLPAPLPACRHRVQRRPARPVPVGVRMEDRFRPSPPAAGRPPSARSCPRQWAPREFWSRRHAVSVFPPPSPEAESTSPTTSGSRSCTGCSSDPSRIRRSTPVHSRRTLVGLDLLVRLPHLLLRDIERLVLATSARPRDSSRNISRLIETNKPRMTRPLRSTPITGASPLLRAGPPARPATVLSASRFLPLGALPLATPASGRRSIGTRLLTFRAKAADQAHVASMPGTAWPVSGHPPGSSRDRKNTPVSDAIL